MILNTIHELCFENNDICQIESCADKIIANEDYHRVRILDLSLNIIKIIPFMEKLVVFSIYKKYDNSAIMLYAPEQNSLFFVNLETFKHFTIKPETHLNDYFFGRNYYWQNNTLIFTEENKNTFYQIDFESSMLKQISTKTVKAISPTFFDFWKACKKHNAITIYPNQSAFIFQKNRKLIAFYDYKNKNLHTVFNVPKDEILKLIDEAWAMKGAPLISDSAVYIVDMKKSIGLNGESAIKIVVIPGISEIITAYPVSL